MPRKALDLRELSDLIRVAADSNVQRLKLANICEVVFVQEKTKSPELTTPVFQTKEAEIAMQSIEQEGLSQDKRSEEKEHLELDVIEDPSGFEKKLVENELEDDRVYN